MSNFLVTTDLNDYNKLVGRVAKLPQRIEDKTGQVLRKMAIDLRNNIIKSMKGTQRAPWFYMRGKKKHHPSLPGSPPAPDTGDLWSKGIQADANPETGEFRVGALNNFEYAEYLEEPKDESRARPFLKPQMKNIDNMLKESVQYTIQKAIKETFR